MKNDINEFLDIIKSIIKHPEYQKRKTFFKDRIKSNLLLIS